MKSTGIVRPIDSLGRVVIPSELRRVFNITDKDPLEIYTEDNMIVLKKYEPSCIFCQSMENLVTYKGRCVCAECVRRMQDAAQDQL